MALFNCWPLIIEIELSLGRKLLKETVLPSLSLYPVLIDLVNLQGNSSIDIHHFEKCQSKEVFLFPGLHAEAMSFVLIFACPLFYDHAFT